MVRRRKVARRRAAPSDRSKAAARHQLPGGGEPSGQFMPGKDGGIWTKATRKALARRLLDTGQRNLAMEPSMSSLMVDRPTDLGTRAVRSQGIEPRASNVV